METNIQYSNIRADIDTYIILNFNRLYLNTRYISYNLIHIMKNINY